MSRARYDVVVVGAGCAGLTAAIGLARAGFAVAVVEAEQAPGGENESGGVCFTESLAQPDILGPDGVEALAWGRRLIERGSFASDGRRLVGTTYRDPDAFRHCFTVLWPRFGRDLAQIAVKRGVVLMTGTTVESLIRDGRRVIGIATSRGPVYGSLVFLAEGDAGHLVSREGYDRSGDPRDAPPFLCSLEQMIELPPGAIEERFGVEPEQGVAYDLLLRNPRRNGESMALNVRGFVCTNRQSLTAHVVLPAEHLAQHFDGDPRQLLEWFADMPALRRWWGDGRRGAYAARLLRGGGRDIPFLVDDGLAIGGAAAGLGVDFPVLNSTGPATATGLMLSRAVARIRAEDGDFRRDRLQRHYLEPLQQTRYWKDAEFLQRWPGYVEKTHVLFDQALDLLLDSAEVWDRPRRWLPVKLLGWFRVLSGVRWVQWSELQHEFFQVSYALRFREVAPRPALARVLLDGALNTFRDLVRQPRPHLPPGGTLRVHYHSANEDGAAPFLLRHGFERFRPVLASADGILHRNDDMPLSAKLTGIVELLVRQINLLDVLASAGLAFLTVLASIVLAAGGSLLRCLVSLRGGSEIRGMKSEPRAPSVADFGLCTSDPPRAGPPPSIHIVWKSALPRQRAEAVRGLEHVCPAGVFEVRGEPTEGVRVAVYPEKCIQCEACWRINPHVDWARGGSSHPPEKEAGAALASSEDSRNGEALRLLDQLEHKLMEFETALAKEPATVDRARADHLEMLARYAQQLAGRALEVLQESSWPTGAARRQALELGAALMAKAEERTRRTWDGRFAWAAADGRQLRQHHLAGLHRLLGVTRGQRTEDREQTICPLSPGQGAYAPRSSGEDAAAKHLLADIAARRYLLETLEHVPVETPLRAELLAVVSAEARDGMASQAAELRDVLGGAGEPLFLPSPPLRRRGVGGEGAAREAYRRHGPRLFAESEQLRALLDVACDWQTLAQRHALLAEREEIHKAEARLSALAHDWRNGPREQPTEAEVGAGFARQAAHLLAGKFLLLRTHARLEDGIDSELEMVLLRVWLDESAARLDEFASLVHRWLHPPAADSDRPLVEPGFGPPLKMRDEYLTASVPYVSGDFLISPVDLLQPRLVPEMADSRESDTTDAHAVVIGDLTSVGGRIEEARYLAESLAVETIGRLAHPQTRSLDLEAACARLIAAGLQHGAGAMRERCVILQALAGEVMPRLLRGGVATGLRHMGREALELEALKADFRQRLLAAWQLFGDGLGRNPDVQASCFALAEAAAWLKAADSTLGRMAWISRLSQTEDGDEPPAQQDLGRHALALCHAEVRDRLHRFDEDLAALRRGYYAPHVRAAALLSADRRVEQQLS